MNGEGKPFPVIQTEFEERHGQFSPDGQWVAYQSNESGRFEIYARSFRGSARPVRMSIAGGAQARWNPAGNELFYMGLDGRLMAVPVRPSSDRQSLEAGTPIPLFQTHSPRAVEHIDGQHYVVSPDGQRFLVNTAVTGDAIPISIILNWKPK